MWCRRVAGFGVLLLCVLVGCSDAPTGDASGIGEVVNDGTSDPPEEPQSSGPAPVTETKTDMLLSAIVTAAEDNDPLPEAKDEKDKKKAEAARVAQEAVDLSEALQAVALRAQVDGNGKPIILDFHGRYLTDDGLAKLKGQVTLQQLFLSQQSGISDIGLEHLKGPQHTRAVHYRSRASRFSFDGKAKDGLNNVVLRARHHQWRALG